MNTTKRLLSSLDLIAPSVELSFQKRRRQGTFLGGVISLLTLLMISYLSLA